MLETLQIHFKEVHKIYNAVDIDVPKGKNAVAVMQPGGAVLRRPFDIPHTSRELNSLTRYISSLESETKIVIECTDRYQEPIARALSIVGLFVSAVNPNLILLPEYNTAMGIYGIGNTYGPQPLVEIGDVSKFTHRKTLPAFASVNPGVVQSGQFYFKSNRTSKCGASQLRKTLFQNRDHLATKCPC